MRRRNKNEEMELLKKEIFRKFVKKNQKFFLRFSESKRRKMEK